MCAVQQYFIVIKV